jgi:L-threonylcarbamoyladenylate synthase
VTRTLKIDPNHPDAKMIADAARALRRGELVAFPTETVYGLGANALDTEAVERIFRAKGRPPTDPHMLITGAGIPIAAPSANRFSRPSPTSASHVLADLDGLIDIIIDGGPTSIGVESTIVDLTVSPALVRRPGSVTLAELRRIVPGVMSSVEFAEHDRAQSAPGQMLRHYAPRARLTLYVGPVDAVARRVSADARAAAAAGSRVGVLSPAEDLLALAPRLAALGNTGRIITMPYGARRDPSESARDLFRALRALDAEGVDIILASAADVDGIGPAIIDRLTRAAEGRVVRLQE